MRSKLRLSEALYFTIHNSGRLFQSCLIPLEEMEYFFWFRFERIFVFLRLGSSFRGVGNSLNYCLASHNVYDFCFGRRNIRRCSTATRISDLYFARVPIAAFDCAILCLSGTRTEKKLILLNIEGNYLIQNYNFIIFIHLSTCFCCGLNVFCNHL